MKGFIALLQGLSSPVCKRVSCLAGGILRTSLRGGGGIGGVQPSWGCLALLLRARAALRSGCSLPGRAFAGGGWFPSCGFAPCARGWFATPWSC